MHLRVTLSVVCLAAAASAMGWAALVHADTDAHGDAPAQQVSGAQPSGDVIAAADWTRLLGTAHASANAPVPIATPQPEIAALRLEGVVAAQQHSLAVIAVDSKPSRVYAIGAVVHGDLLVRSVSAGGVVLARRDGGEPVVLALARPTASGSVHPSGMSAALAGAAIAATDDTEDASPIVPPHADMRAPTARQAATPGSDWARLRANPPVFPQASDEPPAPAAVVPGRPLQY